MANMHTRRCRHVDTQEGQEEGSRKSNETSRWIRRLQTEMAIV